MSFNLNHLNLTCSPMYTSNNLAGYMCSPSENIEGFANKSNSNDKMKTAVSALNDYKSVLETYTKSFSKIINHVNSVFGDTAEEESSSVSGTPNTFSLSTPAPYSPAPRSESRKPRSETGKPRSETSKTRSETSKSSPKSSPAPSPAPKFSPSPSPAPASKKPINANSLLKSIEGLTAWYDATDPLDGGALPKDGAIIEKWMDKSKNKYDLTNYGASKPKFNSSGVNSLPSIQFSDGRSVLRTDDTFDTAPSVTVFVVLNIKNNATGHRFQHAIDQGFPPGSVTLTEIRNPARMTLSVVPGNNGYKESFPITTDTVAMYKITIVDNKKSDLQQTDSAGTSSFSVNQNGGKIFKGRIFVGGQNDIAGMYGHMCEVIYYQSALSQENQKKVEGYLAWKWGLNKNLPKNHPYFTKEFTL